MRQSKRGRNIICLKILVLFLLLSGTTTYLTAQNNFSSKAASASLRRKVEEMNQKQIEAFNKGDLLSVARIYADDATIYFPNWATRQGGKIQGREAIDKYWLAIKKPKEWKLEIVEVGGTKDTIWEIGKSTLTEEYDGKDSTYVGDFIVIWKRQKDGSYRIHTDIYN